MSFESYDSLLITNAPCVRHIRRRKRKSDLACAIENNQTAAASGSIGQEMDCAIGSGLWRLSRGDEIIRCFREYDFHDRLAMSCRGDCACGIVRVAATANESGIANAAGIFM